MGNFKELDPEVVRKLLEGYQDELAPEEKKNAAFYRQFKCTRGCGDLQREFDMRHAFADPDVLTPRALLRCPHCRYLMDPFTGLVIEVGDPSKVPMEASPILRN